MSNAPMTPHPAAGSREIFAWAMYDFANSGYTTVVLTAIYSAYFVGVVANSSNTGDATFLWTLAIAIANSLVLISAPILGAIADRQAWKKRFLIITTVGCAVGTAMLATTGPGDVAWATGWIVLASFLYYTGENLIAAFLPEIAPHGRMGWISGYGWTIGYLGGLAVLALCLAYIRYAQAHGSPATHYVPMTMLIVAVCFVLAALPTFLWLRERTVPQPRMAGIGYIRMGWRRLLASWTHARHYVDLTRFLFAVCVFHCGINTVIVLAAIYAQQAMGFTMQDTLLLIIVVNLTAAVGAALFGRLQDRIGAITTLRITLLIWICAMILAYFATERPGFWVVANLVGLAMGASQSAGRALVGLFCPPERAAEFFGLWGVAVKLANIIGPLSYGVIAAVTAGNHRVALVTTVVYFALGFALLFAVDEKRGRAAAGLHY
ncbi:MAG: MFS transporter [Pseudomonadota bacterium]